MFPPCPVGTVREIFIDGSGTDVPSNRPCVAALGGPTSAQNTDDYSEKRVKITLNFALYERQLCYVVLRCPTRFWFTSYCGNFESLGDIVDRHEYKCAITWTWPEC